MTFRAAVAGAVLAWAGIAGAEPRPAHVLIWGGGKTRDAAEASLSAYQERSKQGQWLDVLTLAQGYPRILKSDDVPGLKPGFEVVVLGACEPERAPKVLETLKAFEPAVYSREATWAEPLACPQPGAQWRMGEARTWKKKQLRMTAVLMERIPDKESPEKKQRLHVALLSPDGKLLDSDVVDEEKERGQSMLIVLDEDGPTATYNQFGPGCTAGPRARHRAALSPPKRSWTPAA